MQIPVQDAMTRGDGLMRGAMGAPVGPFSALRSVGPVGVVAHQLPFSVEPGALPVDADVRPHPHIGLVAVTVMLQGHITHRDSLGNRREVGPGDVSWTLAGSGVVHSERLERLRVLGGSFELLQILIALPDGHEEDAPNYHFVPSAEVPVENRPGLVIRRLAGAGTALELPCDLFLHLVQAEGPGAEYAPPQAEQRALYVLEGSVRVGGTEVHAQQTAVLPAGAPPAVALGPTRYLAFGGQGVGPRLSWWNYMHSSLERIEAAKADWRAGRVPLPPGDTESFTPAPRDDERPLHRVNAANVTSWP